MTQDFYDTVAQLALELSPNRIAGLAKALSGLAHEELQDAFRENCGPNCDRKLCNRFLQILLEDSSITGQVLASSLLAAEAAARKAGGYARQELLWTGPATATVPVRQTEEGLLQVIRYAKRDLFIVSFVVYAIPNVMEALLEAQERKVTIRFLLEQAQEEGGKVTVDSMALLKKKLPDALFFIWNQTGADSAAVHAKCAVADGKMAMISSANLTGKAMNDNMEAGILLNGGTVPEQLARHLHALVTEKIITEG